MKIARTASTTLLLLSSLLGACDEPSDGDRATDEEEDTEEDGGDIDWPPRRDSGTTGGGSDGGTAEAGSDASTTRDASTPSGDGGVVSSLETGGDCPTPTGPGTMHSQNITGSETWTAAASPHYLTSSITVEGTLTLEACAQVLLSKDVSLAVGSSGKPGGKLITQGTYEPEANGKPEVIKPVIFDSANDGEFWGSLLVYYQGEAEFHTTALLHGGSVVGGYEGALAARGPNDGSLRRMITAELLVVLESGGYGINLSSGAGFFETPDSSATVLGAGRQPKPAGAARAPIYPVFVTPPGVGTLPPGQYFGSTEPELAENDKIYVYSARAISADEQFHNYGVPYLMEGTFYMRPPAATTTTLKIDPGVELRFHHDASSNASFQIGDGAPIDPRCVKLDIQGTAKDPIVFTSNAATPAAGDWMGLYLDCSPPSGNKLTNAYVLYAGGESGTNGYGCGPKDNDAAILITDWRPADAFIQNVDIRDSAGGGIVSGWASNQAGPDLKTGNLFTRIANGCSVSRWRTEEVNYCEGRTDEAPLCL
ncbi:MAG TPA: hypothetical protein VJU61_04085 [Polyangiaceae bacterium]|nr:hypothetical protein [Polyangiaceae bacterium]